MPVPGIVFFPDIDSGAKMTLKVIQGQLRTCCLLDHILVPVPFNVLQHNCGPILHCDIQRDTGWKMQISHIELVVFNDLVEAMFVQIAENKVMKKLTTSLTILTQGQGVMLVIFMN